MQKYAPKPPQQALQPDAAAALAAQSALIGSKIGTAVLKALGNRAQGSSATFEERKKAFKDVTCDTKLRPGVYAMLNETRASVVGDELRRVMDELLRLNLDGQCALLDQWAEQEEPTLAKPDDTLQEWLRMRRGAGDRTRVAGRQHVAQVSGGPDAAREDDAGHAGGEGRRSRRDAAEQ